MASSLYLRLITLLSIITVCAAQSLHSRDDDDDLPGLHGTEMLRTQAKIAHGVLMSVAICIFFPFGAIILRVFKFEGSVRFHQIWQMTGMFLMIVGFGLACWLSYLHNELWNKAHEQFGTVLFVLFLVQPIFGVMHHRQYVRTGQRGWASRTHVWYGRVLILMGIIDGGMGLTLADNTMGGVVAYAVIMGFLGLAYFIVILNYDSMKEPTWKLPRRKTADSEETAVQMEMQPNKPPQL